VDSAPYRRAARRRRRRALSGEGGRSVLEAILVLIAVSAFVLIAIERYNSSIKSLKETALTIELANLRSAVLFYATINGKLPSSLSDLARENVIATKKDLLGKEYDIIVAGSFVESMTVDREGTPLDAFGSPYLYDRKTGRVSSTTNGYERW